MHANTSVNYSSIPPHHSISLARPPRRLSINLVLDRQLAILLPVFPKDARNTPSNPLLVQLVIRVLASGNVLRQRNASSKDTQVRNRARDSPVEPAAGGVRRPNVERDPDGLLGGEVGVTRELPETSGVEAAVELSARVSGLRFGGALVFGFGGVEVPLLAVGKPLNCDEDDEEAREDVFCRGHGGVQARGQEEDVGGCGDGEEEDLVGSSVRCELRGVNVGLLTLWTDEVKKTFSKKKAGVPIQPLIRFHR
jgi:hypothetical protein